MSSRLFGNPWLARSVSGLGQVAVETEVAVVVAVGGETGIELVVGNEDGGGCPGSSYCSGG